MRSRGHSPLHAARHLQYSSRPHAQPRCVTEISEIPLNHVLKGMNAIYDVREEIPERRQALELGAASLATCERGEEWNVVPIGRAAA